MKREDILNLARSNPEAADSYLKELVSTVEKLEAKKDKLKSKKEKLQAKVEYLEAKNRTRFIKKEILEAKNGKLDPISIELRKRILR
ncbi:MAG: hypothetical protein PHF18_06225 [Methanosarcina sp.]|uniref:hypothetical protein n=1 Tax=Methanosarcina sp. TaxID=2213 RepID=UPI002615B6F1|nr:hypothetical protein [Methanosarcina sp.]MDD3246434.1 hypothetical protein [Methanosarcina sp.]MDD4247928.1 hypothetical protein [Methanosarcina sp.]